MKKILFVVLALAFFVRLPATFAAVANPDQITQLADVIIAEMGRTSAATAPMIDATRQEMIYDVTVGWLSAWGGPDPNWGPAHPKWKEFFDKMEPLVAAANQPIEDNDQEAYKKSLIASIAAHMNEQDVQQAIAFKASRVGQDFNDFNTRIVQLQLGLANKPPNNTKLGDPPVTLPSLTSDQVNRYERMLKQSSTYHSLFSMPMDKAHGKGGSLVLMSFMQPNIQELDALYQQYGGELDSFAAFNDSSAGKSLEASVFGMPLSELFPARRKALADERYKIFMQKMNDVYADFQHEVHGK